MTVTIEKHHGELVDVEVLEETRVMDEYRRKILLRRKSDRRVVQFGIVRINLDTLSETIQSQIVSGEIPLGRILIDNGLMREVQLSQLWQVECGEELAGYFQFPEGCLTFGRTARILVNSLPVIELLEIVAPETEDSIGISKTELT
jgi:chorismate-pyruvate lyase